MARKKDKRKRRTTMAQLADPHDLYQQSVQRPEVDIEFFLKTFKRARKRKPRSMREDFCGTALFSAEWVRENRKRNAVGVDLHGPTLDWGRAHVLAHEPEHVRERVQLIQANVLDVVEPKVDFNCAMNFSFCVFKERDTLRRYFEAVREGLVDDGVFFTELYGGTEAIMELEESRDVEGFTYHWEQAKYNPITNETLCHIHFEFPDGSKLKKAFTYDWRLWSIPEVRELMAEAGFSRSEVYWEGCADDGVGEGVFVKTEDRENQEGWLVYIVAYK
jgi:hypothetical protein